MPDKKCLYRERTESADSIASMAKISKNRLSAVGTAKVTKYAEKYRKSLPIMCLSLYNKIVVV